MTGRDALKAWFVTGAKPTAAQFAALIDSCFNLNDDTLTIGEIQGLANALASKLGVDQLVSISKTTIHITDGNPVVINWQADIVVGTGLTYAQKHGNLGVNITEWDLVNGTPNAAPSYSFTMDADHNIVTLTFSPTVIECIYTII